jgi:site-specific recombinase XerD
MRTQVVALPSPEQDAWQLLWKSFRRMLQADPGISPRTIEVYDDVSHQFHEFLVERGYPVDPAAIQRQHIEDFVIRLQTEPLERTGKPASPATVRNRFSALRRLFNWLEAEEEIDRSPMARMKGIQVEEPTPEVLSDVELRRLLKACEGKEFEDRRDMAVLRLMIDTGLRRFEIAQMTLEGTDLDGHVVRVVGKGGREALAFFGVKAARDLDRYLRMRVHHLHAGLPAFWLAQKGGLTGDGVHHLVQRRARLGGLERRIWPHLFRHSWAHAMKSAGASDEDVMTLGRWRDRKVMARYGASAAVSRARETHKRLSPGDKL